LRSSFEPLAITEALQYSRRQMTARLAAATAALLLTLALGAADAATVAVGSDLGRAPNTAFGCESRPYPDIFSPTGQQFLFTGLASCTWWSLTYGPGGVVGGVSTYVPRGSGRVLRARVRSGNNPAPLRIAIVSSGSQSGFSGRAETAVFQPQPNAVTTVPVNIAAGSGITPGNPPSADPDDPNRGFAYNDVVAVTAVGPGTLPVVEQPGPHGNFANQSPGRAFASFTHPALDPSRVSGGDEGLMDGYEVLLNFDWCGTVGSGARVAQAGCPGSGAVRRVRATARVSRGRAALPLRCTTRKRCRGSITLRALSQRIGGGTFSIKGRKAATVRVKLTKAGRTLTNGPATIAATADLTFKGGGSTVLAFALKR
jgi:hypothetical protein